MEALLIGSAYLLYNQYNQYTNQGQNEDNVSQNTNSTPLLGTGANNKQAPWVYPSDDSGAVTRNFEANEELKHPQAAPSYKPSWLRQFDAPEKKAVETEAAHPSAEYNPEEEVQKYFNIRNFTNKAAVNTLGHQTLGQGVSLTGPDFVRPPRKGGYDGYDDERGRNPVPRYFQFNLGEDFTQDSMNLKDAGLSRGFAYGQAGKMTSERQENFLLRPDRDMIGNNDQTLNQAPINSTWFRGEHDTRLTGRGPGAAREKNYVLPNDDPLDKRLRDEFVPSDRSSQGASRIGSVFRGTERLDRNVTRTGPPENDLQKPFDTSRGLSRNPVTKVNYMTKQKDYVPPNSHFRQVSITPVNGTSKFTKMHSTSSTLTKDNVQWTYTFDIKEAKNLIEAAKVRKVQDGVRGKVDFRNEGISQDRQIYKQGLDLLNLQTKAETSNVKPVLFSDEERNAYKLDPKFSLERNLELPGVHSKGLASFKGATSQTAMSLPYDLVEKQTLNSNVRNSSNQESSIRQLQTGGAERVPIHYLPVESTFQQQNTKVDDLMVGPLSDPTFAATKGVSRANSSIHLKNDAPLILPSLTGDKTEIQNGSGMGSGKFSIAPPDDITNRITSVKNSDTAVFFDNDILGDNAGMLTLPSVGGLKTPMQVYSSRLDPARESLQVKKPPVRKRK
jgi:hypothetical protein